MGCVHAYDATDGRRPSRLAVLGVLSGRSAQGGQDRRVPSPWHPHYARDPLGRPGGALERPGRSSDFVQSSDTTRRQRRSAIAAEMRRDKCAGERLDTDTDRSIAASRHGTLHRVVNYILSVTSTSTSAVAVLKSVLYRRERGADPVWQLPLL